MEAGAVKSNWLDSKWAALAGGLAGIATVVTVALLALALSEWVPSDSALVDVSGDVVVMEGNYAHLMTDAGPLKITYGCACATGWKPGMRDSSRVEARVKRVNSRRAEAHHVVVDGQVLVDIERARAHYLRKSGFFGGLVLLCLPLWVVRRAHRRHHSRGGGSVAAQWLAVLEDEQQPWARRQEALDAVVGHGDPALPWTLRELCSRNTESVAALEAMGTALARQVQAVGDDDVLEEDLVYLQLPARRAFDAAMREADGGALEPDPGPATA